MLSGWRRGSLALARGTTESAVPRQALHHRTAPRDGGAQLKPSPGASSAGLKGAVLLLTLKGWADHGRTAAGQRLVLRTLQHRPGGNGDHTRPLWLMKETGWDVSKGSPSHPLACTGGTLPAERLRAAGAAARGCSRLIPAGLRALSPATGWTTATSLFPPL